MSGAAARFAGRVAVVTGAGTGLGALYASAFAREGAAVVAVDRDAAGAERTAATSRGAGGECRAVAADLARQDAVARMVDEALSWHGRIDVIVNNAGGGSSETASATTLGEEDSASWDALEDANVKTAFLCTRAVAEPMKRARYGRIVNVSSRAARINDAHVPQSPAYTAAKAGVMALTRFAARELGPFGVTVNCLVPSLTLSGPRLEAYWERWGEVARERYLEQVALRRLPRPEEIVAALLFLASDESSYITGVCLDVNGGSFMA
jgi:NAD(P)-dependent dehydrogenase (short-subunit alcohol dehydrogenase family)